MSMKVSIGAVVLGVLMLAGCASNGSTNLSSIDLSKIDWAKAQKNWATVQAIGQFVGCQVSQGALIAANAAAAVRAKQAAIDTAGNVVTVSSMVCQQMGGAPVAAPAPAAPPK